MIETRYWTQNAHIMTLHVIISALLGWQPLLVELAETTCSLGMLYDYELPTVVSVHYRHVFLLEQGME